VVLLEPEFKYTDKIEEIAPLTLNLTFTRKDADTVTFELRKKASIKLSDNNSKEFWINFFSNSLEGKTIKSNMIIVFRDKFGSACKLKELGLLKPKTKIATD
jgi:hypothetical protein